MNKKYGSSRTNFIVFIEHNANIYSNYFLFSINVKSYASFENINPEYKNWTYLFCKVWFFHIRPIYTLAQFLKDQE